MVDRYQTSGGNCCIRLLPTRQRQPGFMYKILPHHTAELLLPSVLFSQSKTCLFMWVWYDWYVFVLFCFIEVHLVVVTQGHHLHHVETEVLLQKEAVREMDLQRCQMPLHLCWTSLKSLHQQFRKVVLIETLMQPRVIRGLQDHGSKAPEDPLAQVKIISVLLNEGPPLWSSGQSFWIQIQRSRVRFPALPDFSE